MRFIRFASCLLLLLGLTTTAHASVIIGGSATYDNGAYVDWTGTLDVPIGDCLSTPQCWLSNGEITLMSLSAYGGDAGDPVIDLTELAFVDAFIFAESGDLSDGYLWEIHSTNNSNAYDYIGSTYRGFLAVANNGGDSRLADIVTVSTTPVPEPATLALMGLGLAGLGATRRKKK